MKVYVATKLEEKTPGSFLARRRVTLDSAYANELANASWVLTFYMTTPERLEEALLALYGASQPSEVWTGEKLEWARFEFPGMDWTWGCFHETYLEIPHLLRMHFRKGA